MTIVDSPTIRIERDEAWEKNTSSLAILYVGSMGSTQLSGGDHEHAAQETNSWPGELVTSVIHKHHGQVIRRIGGSVTAEFSEPAFAIRAAVEVQRGLLESNRGLAQHDQAGLRIGIHGLVGDRQEIDAFSDVVYMAASIARHAAPGQILISREVCDAVSNETDLHCQWFRAVAFDGAGDSGDVFEVHWAESSASIPSRYEVLCQVGTGGMGIVYKVRDRETDDVIALKILKSGIASDPAMQESLRREVSLARKVTHKNVCRIHEFNRSGGMAYISMEYVEGESLLSKLHRSGPLPWDEALEIGRQICSGLREAHIQGIVHRDLKPANIMVDRSGSVKIMDFGIARLFQGTTHMTGTLVGTPAYMAPEQVELKRVDARTDVYALGLLLYEIVTGLPAFDGETPIAVAIKQLREFPKHPREIMPALPAHAEAAILRCLQKDPAKRFQSVDQLAAVLRGKSRAKPVSLWASFVADFRATARALHRDLQPRIDEAGEFLRRQHWRALTTKRAHMALAGGLGVACLLSGLVVFSARRSGKNQVDGAAAANASAVMMVQGAGSSNDRDRSFRPASQPSTAPPIASYYDIDLGATSAPAPEERTLSDANGPDDPQYVKAQPSFRAAGPSSRVRRATTTSGASKARWPQPEVAGPAASPSDMASSEQRTGETSSDLSAYAVPSTPPSAPNEAASSEKATESGPTPPGRYLEVGSFKDSTWADHAVEKLMQLGFHAVSVHKNLLWMQSYQVRVGPYAAPQDLDAARAVLVSQGLKPHQVK